MATREAPDRHQRDHRTIAIRRLWRSRSLSHRGDTRTIRSPSSGRSRSDGHDDSWKNSTIATRSSRDQGANVVESPPSYQTATDRDSGSRLTHDRGSIVAKIVVFFRLIRSHNDAHSMPIGKPRCRPKESLPRPSKTASMTASMTHEIGQISSLKIHVFLLCSSTFDRLVKKLSEF